MGDNDRTAIVLTVAMVITFVLFAIGVLSIVLPGFFTIS